MKVLFKNLVAGYTGRVDDLVIYYSKQVNKCIVRRVPERKADETNRTFAKAQRNIYYLQPSEGYKQDLTAYIALYNKTQKFRDKPLNNWTNPYAILMYEMQRRMADQVDLKTITRQQIYEQDLPCISVKDAVKFGLLPKVMGFEQFDNPI